ncbi:MAG: tRNA (N6-threonylcarbamoyladenosine(37)-N6)-methyltransferase TrmO [Planctomycetota bacterium]
MKINIKPIGIIHTPYKKPHDVPLQAYKSKKKGRVTVYREFAEGLADIDGFSYIIIIFYFHKAHGYKLKAIPYRDNVPRGIFAIKGPWRPNHIGVTTVRLLKRIGRELIIKGMDIVDGSPLLDIKPYVPPFDERTNAKIGWLEGKIKR